MNVYRIRRINLVAEALRAEADALGGELPSVEFERRVTIEFSSPTTILSRSQQMGIFATVAYNNVGTSHGTPTIV